MDIATLILTWSRSIPVFVFPVHVLLQCVFVFPNVTNNHP